METEIADVAAYETTDRVRMEEGWQPHDFIRLNKRPICAVMYCASGLNLKATEDVAENERRLRAVWGHPIHTNRFALRAQTAVVPSRSLPNRPPPQPSSAPLMPSRQQINIDPVVREALYAHLTTRYAGTGVGYSEFIRRALLWDMADVPVPDKVQADNRWSGTYFPHGIADLNEEAQK